MNLRAMVHANHYDYPFLQRFLLLLYFPPDLWLQLKLIYDWSKHFLKLRATHYQLAFQLRGEKFLEPLPARLLSPLVSPVLTFTVTQLAPINIRQAQLSQTKLINLNFSEGENSVSRLGPHRI